MWQAALVNTLQLGCGVKEEQKDSSPSWLLNDLVLPFQNTELLNSQESFKAGSKRGSYFSEGLE